MQGTDTVEYMQTCQRFALHPFNSAEREAHIVECEARHNRLAALQRSAQVQASECVDLDLSEILQLAYLQCLGISKYFFRHQHAHLGCHGLFVTSWPTADGMLHLLGTGDEQTSFGAQVRAA